MAKGGSHGGSGKAAAGCTGGGGKSTGGGGGGPLKAAASSVAQAVGFGGSGIQPKSLAASFMSSYGGSVPRGSLCAGLQSLGASGSAAKSSSSQGGGASKSK